MLLLLKTQEVIHEFPTKHADERIWVEATEKEVMFIAETGVQYKLGTTNLCSKWLAYSKLNNNYNLTLLQQSIL